MGLNAFFAYTVVLSMGYTYNHALVIVFISGIFFIVITKIGLREAIIRAIPDCVKKAITPGIGLFITIVGLKNCGLIVGHPSTLLSMPDFSAWRTNPESLHAIACALVALFGLLVMGILHAKHVKGSIFIGIAAATVLGIPFGVTNLQNFSMNLGEKMHDFMELSFFHLDFKGLFAGENLAHSISTATGVLLGTSTVTTVVESSAGIAEGGRTGMTSFVTAMLFLGSIILAPIVGIIPGAATAPALIFVGILMLSNIKNVDFSDMREALPAFCTIVFMPFTYSIANGIAFGLITYCIMSTFTGNGKKVKPLAWIIALVFMLRYTLMSM